MPSAPVLDPNAVDELFENVVFGDGLAVLQDADQQGAEQRRLTAHKRRLDAAQKALENAAKRVRAEEDERFFTSLVTAGPDRRPAAVVPPPPPTATKAAATARIAIPFTASDRSRIPRKTRQQWLDKFTGAADLAFPGAVMALGSAAILALEQSVYQAAKSPTAYIGAWINKIHEMKKAGSLAEFVVPTRRLDPSVVDDVVPSRRPNSEGTAAVAESHPAPPRLSSGRSRLLGNDLPFSLFGSDDDDDHDPALGGQYGLMAPAVPVPSENVAEIDREIADPKDDDDQKDENEKKGEEEKNGEEEKKDEEKKDEEKKDDEEEKGDERRKFVMDVVVAHLRFRFGADLDEKTTFSVQTKVVGKILGDGRQQWTLDRLRRHKRSIDHLAEEYARRLQKAKKPAL